MARPRNADKYSPQAQKEMVKVLVGEALAQLRKQIKKADPATLATFVQKMLPVVLNEDNQTTSDVTLDLLAQKAIKVSLRIRDAHEQNLTSEEIEGDDDTPEPEQEVLTNEDEEGTSHGKAKEKPARKNAAV